jgi:hypothetical protein
MNSAPIGPTPEPHAPRSLATLAAALVTCTHPESSRLPAAPGRGPGAASANWCAACGALFTEDPAAPWQAPSLTSALSRKAFEELVLLLHAVMQLAQLARTEAPVGPTTSPAHTFLRHLRASLSALSRLPVVRDVERIEEALAQMPKFPAQPCR